MLNRQCFMTQQFSLKFFNLYLISFKRFTIGLLVMCLFTGNLGAETTLQSNQEVVILIHGLGRTYRSMKKLQKNLVQEGYIVRNIKYPSKKHSIKTLVDSYIAPIVNDYRNQAKIHFVGHSLGGILTRVYLNNYSISNLGRVVMMGTPNKGSSIVNKLRDYSVCRWYLGPAFLELSTDLNSVPNSLTIPDYPLGLIAGTKSVNPFLSQFVKGENDGKVSVESVRLGNYPLKKIHVSHTWIMTHNDVIENVINFLKYETFLD